MSNGEENGELRRRHSPNNCVVDEPTTAAAAIATGGNNGEGGDEEASLSSSSLSAAAATSGHRNNVNNGEVLRMMKPFPANNDSRSRKALLGEIVKEHAELRRRRSHDPDHHLNNNNNNNNGNNSNSNNNNNSNATSTHFHQSHMSLSGHHQPTNNNATKNNNNQQQQHEFQDEVFKAFRSLQHQRDDKSTTTNEHQGEKKLLLDSSNSSNNNNNNNGTNDSSLPLQQAATSTAGAYGGMTASSSQGLFKYKLTMVDEQQLRPPSSIASASSPPPPALSSSQLDERMFASHFLNRQASNHISSTGCKPWFVTLFLLWLLSPRNMALCARLAGITAAVLSAFFSAVNYAISEYLEENFDPVEVFAWRQTLLIFYCFPVASYYQKPMYFKRGELRLWWPMILRSVGSSLAILFIYEAVEYIPLSDATVVSNAAPIFCSIFARIMLKEKFGIAEVLCSIAVICGVTLNAQPTWLFDFSLLTTGLQKRLIGLAFALGAALATAFTTVIMRTMKQVHFSSQQLMFSYISSILIWPLVFVMGVARYPPCGLTQKLIVLAIGFTALPAQALLIYACQNEKAGIVSLARSTMPVFALIFQISCFGIFPDLYSILGNLVILGAILGLAVKMLRDSNVTHHHPPMNKAADGDDDDCNIAALASQSNLADISSNINDQEITTNPNLNSFIINNSSHHPTMMTHHNHHHHHHLLHHQQQASHYLQLLNKGGNNSSDVFSPESTITSVLSAAAAFQHSHSSSSNNNNSSPSMTAAATATFDDSNNNNNNNKSDDNGLEMQLGMTVMKASSNDDATSHKIG